MSIIAALICGLIFGAGLTVSQMTETQKIQNFLDVSGAWDPSLIVVMAAALIVTFIGYLLARRQAAPLLAPRALWPTRNEIDAPLVGGAVLFGIGWGLIGFCPGPAIVDLSTGAPPVILFVAAMAVGMIAQNLLRPAPRLGNEAALEAGD
ncbi:MAG TPA: YeeE/YedE family protein [Stellaceae bacterium]|jgi:hypothetical protein|nr:YeeE/YedE family protein [Stellaceae bacterium]